MTNNDAVIAANAWNKVGNSYSKKHVKCVNIKDDKQPDIEITPIIPIVPMVPMATPAMVAALWGFI
jgi:hypothetical protein